MKNKKGFTMIELLVVISVIVLLTALVIIAITQVRVKANNSRIKGDMDQLRKQAEAIYAENSMESYCTAKVCFRSNEAKLSELVKDISDRNGNVAPVLSADASSFCLSAQMADDKTICYDNSGAQTGTTYGKLNGSGVCAGGEPFVCQ